MSLITQKIDFLGANGTTHYYLNDKTSLKSGFASSPHYYIQLTNADGFYGSDISSESHPIPHSIGEFSGDSFRRGKGINLAGTIEGRAVPDLKAGAIYLAEVFWNTSPRKLIYKAEDGTSIYLVCKVLNDLVVSEVLGYNPKWTWTVGLRADDPRPRKLSDDSVFYSWMS